MKRFHIHIGVTNLEESIKFYSALFGMKPAKIKDDYAKWMLDDPRINFAISTKVNVSGVDHLGIQVDHDSELVEFTQKLKNAGLNVFGEGKSTCCYSESEKSWVKDPSGVPWEVYMTMADANIFSEKQKKSTNKNLCCPTNSQTKGSCC